MSAASFLPDSCVFLHKTGKHEPPIPKNDYSRPLQRLINVYYEQKVPTCIWYYPGSLPVWPRTLGQRNPNLKSRYHCPAHGRECQFQEDTHFIRTQIRPDSHSLRPSVIKNKNTERWTTSCQVPKNNGQLTTLPQVHSRNTMTANSSCLHEFCSETPTLHKQTLNPKPTRLIWTNPIFIFWKIFPHTSPPGSPSPPPPQVSPSPWPSPAPVPLAPRRAASPASRPWVPLQPGRSWMDTPSKWDPPDLLAVKAAQSTTINEPPCPTGNTSKSTANNKRLKETFRKSWNNDHEESFFAPGLTLRGCQPRACLHIEVSGTGGLVGLGFKWFK